MLRNVHHRVVFRCCNLVNSFVGNFIPQLITCYILNAVVWTWHKRSRAIPVFLKVTLSLPCLWASFFHPLSLLWVRSPKQGKFIKSGYEMLRSSENICSSQQWRRSGKMKDRMKLSLPKKNCCISEFHNSPNPPPPHLSPWMQMYSFGGSFLISPGFAPNLGFWCCVFRTLLKALLSDYRAHYWTCSSFFNNTPKET
jgi:hypothetical protein